MKPEFFTDVAKITKAALFLSYKNQAMIKYIQDTLRDKFSISFTVDIRKDFKEDFSYDEIGYACFWSNGNYIVVYKAPPQMHGPQAEIHQA